MRAERDARTKLPFAGGPVVVVHNAGDTNPVRRLVVEPLLEALAALTGEPTREILAWELDVEQHPGGVAVGAHGVSLHGATVFARIMNDERLAAVPYAIEAAGNRVVNSPAAAAIAQDKTVCAFRLAQAGVSVVPGVVAVPGTGWVGRVSSWMTWPLIVKPSRGWGGDGVELVRDEAALSCLEDEIAAGSRIVQPHIIQPYVEAEDLRALVVGGEVVAAMQRVRAVGEHRANLHAGGRAVRTTLLEDEVKLAVRAAAAVGLDVAGVDILRTPRGAAVLEVNSTPGWQIADVAGVDVAGTIARHLVSIAQEA